MNLTALREQHLHPDPSLVPPRPLPAPDTTHLTVVQTARPSFSPLSPQNLSVLTRDRHLHARREPKAGRQLSHELVSGQEGPAWWTRKGSRCDLPGSGVGSQADPEFGGRGYDLVRLRVRFSQKHSGFTDSQTLSSFPSAAWMTLNCTTSARPSLSIRNSRPRSV